MTREEILQEIHRTTEQNGGQPLGREAFAKRTGIKKSEWYGRFWARWGDALEEAGFQPNQFTEPTPEEFLLSKLAELVRELGRYPVHGELQLKAQADPTFPNTETFRKRLGKTNEIRAKLQEFCQKHGINDVLPFCQSKAPPASNEPRLDQKGIGEGRTLGHVYLMKSGRFYKLGRTNHVGRRHWELGIQLPEKLNLIHSIATDDPIGIEKYWHGRFSDRRANGEWFELTKADIDAFKRRKFM